MSVGVFAGGGGGGGGTPTLTYYYLDRGSTGGYTLAAGSAVALFTLTLGAGTWFVFGRATVSVAATGVVTMYVHTPLSNVGSTSFRFTSLLAGKALAELSTTGIITLASAGQAKLYVYNATTAALVIEANGCVNLSPTGPHQGSVLGAIRIA